MNPDGISYLDIGDAYFRGDWHNAVNAYWSPLYSWVLGLANAAVNPGPYGEFPLAHLINFLIFCLCLVAFEFLVTGLLAADRNQESQNTRQMPPPGFVWIVSYALFLLFTLQWQNIETVSPDLLLTQSRYTDGIRCIPKSVSGLLEAIVIECRQALQEALAFKVRVPVAKNRRDEIGHTGLDGAGCVGRRNDHIREQINGGLFLFCERAVCRQRQIVGQQSS